MRHVQPARALAFGLPMLSLIALSACNVSAGGATADLKAPYPRVAYVSPSGEGEQTGRTPEHALPLSAVESVLRDERGDLAVMFAPGRYPLEGSISIRERGRGVRTALIGAEDGAVFVGDAELREEERKFAAFRLSASNVRFENLRFERLGGCVSVVRDGVAQNVLIENMRAEDVHDCIVVDAYEPRVAADWRIDGLEVHGFRRVAVRLAGARTSDIELEHVEIDGANSFERSDCYKGGVQILEGAHHITLRDVEIRNVVGDCGDDYAQGDGVEVHDRDGAPHDLLFEDVTVENVRDGGFDLKGRNVRLVDVRAVRGPASRYAFRFWNYPGYVCERCEADGADTALIFARNGSATFSGGRLRTDGETRLCELEREQGRVDDTFIAFGEDVGIESRISPASCAAPGETAADAG